jgi:hypothetical protein
MKHEKAYCKNGQIFEPRDIKNRNSLVQMRYYGLTDLKKQFELVAVNSQNPFFRFKNSPGNNLSRNEKNPNHNIIKDKIVDKLNSAKSLLVYTYDFIDGKRIDSSIVNLSPDLYSAYKWVKEPFKKISKSEYSYFDICGFSKDEPFSSTVKPTIIIEVIFSSFLKNRVFEFHCKNSKIENMICLFFYIPENLPKMELSNYWNAIVGDEDIKMRITQYIDNGFFYHGKSEIVYLGKDKKENDEFVRPNFSSYETETEYWDKHFIYIEEHYVKKIKQEFKDKKGSN